MDMAELDRIAQHGLAGEFRLNEPMRKHTTWRTGGPADRAYFPHSLEDLARFVRAIPKDEPVYVVGLGSNLLVRDAGLRGTVVFTHGGLKEIRVEPADGGAPRVYAEAGVASPKVARFAANHGLRGAEFLAGIPGTLGGALAMNAGCYGAETWEVVESALCLRHDGQLILRTAGDFDIAYRHVALRGAQPPRAGDPSPTANHESRVANRESEVTNHELRDTNHAPLAPEWFLAAWLRLPPGDADASRRAIKDLLQRRIATQPLDQPNAGSVFRNPPGDYAARLIESCGLKGFAIGGAMVSPKHANFIVNPGRATSADIEHLIEKVQKTVWERCQVQLEREIRIVGERS
jgi:UDP-N-acetylmuramate dehydrogenase